MSRPDDREYRRRVALGQGLQARRLGQAVPTGTPRHRQPSSRRGRPASPPDLDVELAGRLRVVRAELGGEPVIVVTTIPSDSAGDDPAWQARRWWQASHHTDPDDPDDGEGWS